MTLPAGIEANAQPVLYFGYGSNMWQAQMRRRCPESKFVGIALLKDWKWIINTRRYANIIPSQGDHVYALVYELTPSDESSLDRYEGVPTDYIKKYLPVHFTSTTGKQEKVDMLVYVDVERVEIGQPYAEYIDRINWGIVDAIKHGVPREYIDKYLRPFIRADNEDEVVEDTQKE
ncbi:hypothetical protein M422DRAFT_151765 [Sphaerobolus stellatus SS14]|nr:hypothetical protein M422DRAFT_151765 [Sphaerobolus stellatus SS14]